MLPEYNVLDPRLGHLSREERVKLQGERLRLQVQHCYENAPFWRKKFNDAGITPDDIRGVEDLQKIPFCHKQEIQKDQDENPPFGSYLAVDRSKLVEFFATSGTTGRPIKRVFTARDWNYYIRSIQRMLFLNSGDVVMVLGPTDGLMGPSGGVAARALMNTLIVRAARYSTPDKVRLIHELRPTLVSATASFLLYIAEAADQMGISFAKMGGVKVIETVGEPGGAIPATRARIKEGWGAQIVLDRYGITELFMVGRSCATNSELHVTDDYLIVEVVEIEGNKVLGPGERGELVYTNIVGETQPLLRYRSGDIGRLAKFSPCPGCGSTCTRIVNGVEGRVDDMIWYKGINIFPSAIEAVVRSFNKLSNEYEIVLDQKGAVQTLTVRAEVIKGVPQDNYEKLRQQLEERLLGALEGVHAKVELLTEGTLPQTTTKAKRVRDNRPKPTV